MSTKRPSFTDEEALAFHKFPIPGKISILPTKPMATQRDLALAYSPGVAVPVQAIAENEDLAYDYTSKGNMVAVISNGTAILGLGDLGPMASKPVMEGKSVLFKRFADVDSVDVEVTTKDTEEFITTVRNIGPTYGGINLEDIKSPECFIIESRLRDELNIPVFHDDQHGTAIIAAAGLINACEISGRKFEDTKVTFVGAGAAGLSCAGLLLRLGVRKENLTMCDRDGVLYTGRDAEIDQFQMPFARDTDKRTLADAVDGADVLIGVSAKGVVSKDMIKSMNDNPIIFVMANPDPEIRPEEIREVRDDAIIATGRSDYPNQVNNVLGFPYIFRGALDVRARTINEEMKIAAAQALAQLAREDVPDEVAAAYHGARPKFGPDYIIPVPFDPRLISYIPPFVAKAAMDTGVARKSIEDMEAYQEELERRQDPSASFLQRIQGAIRSETPKRIVFAEGEEPAIIRAAMSFENQGLGRAILVGREDRVKRNMRQLGVPEDSLKIVNAAVSERNPDYFDYLYARLQRKGYLQRDVQRLINTDRNVFGACMVALGDADGLVTGITRSYESCLNDVRLVIDDRAGETVLGMSVVINKGTKLFIADTNITELPNAKQIVNITIEAAKAVRRLGETPRVALVSYSTFGSPEGVRATHVQDAVKILDSRDDIDFEYEGEIDAGVALNPDAKKTYPFMRLSGPANILVMPAIHSASISTSLLGSVGGATILGPVLMGLDASVQICSLGSNSVSDIVNLATVAAYDVNKNTAHEALKT